MYTDETGAVKKSWYTHGADIDEHLAVERDGAHYFYHADGLGSVTAITDSGRNVVQSYAYESFGMLRPSTDFMDSYTYTGREWDREAGLYYYRARYYDPRDGRFISKDTAGINGGINYYSYVHNNVVNEIDPLGLFEYHGNWCGPDWTGGLKEQFTIGHIYKTPKDSFDSCCKVHDICYYKCRKNNPCDFIDRDVCMTNCDRKLASCADSSGHRLHSPLWWWMNFNSTPSPGENAGNCQYN